MGHACWSQLNENILHLRAGVNNCENIHKSKVEMNLDKPELMCAIDHHHSPSTFPPLVLSLSVCQSDLSDLLSCDFHCDFYRLKRIAFT